MFRRAATLCQFFVVFALCPLVIGECQFDKIQLSTEALVHTPTKYHRKRHGRDLAGCPNDKWKPIRISTYFDPEMALTSHEKFRLHEVIERAVHKMKYLLSVEPVVGPLLLSRSKACGAIRSSGPNKGKCASIRFGYQKEYCANKVDNFMIPDNHLRGLDVYNDTSPTPIAERSLSGGHGVKNADYILYLTAAHSDLCLDQNTIAYASYCQMDQNDRPIAGLVNFCPTHLKTTHFSHSKALLVVMHEMFHALGFSAELFLKYKECSSRGHCFPWKRAVTKDDGKFRVMLPSVVSQMQRHFNCTEEELGAPLEPTDDHSITSHWDPLILHQSLMSPYISESPMLFVDPITLAVFDDMGWYRVNYSSADVYNWASGAGCEFVKSPQCNVGSCPWFLCDLRKEAKMNTSGCDYSHAAISMCSAISKHHPDVGIYKFTQQGRCQNGDIHTEDEQACFVSSIHGKKEGECMQFRCIGEELQLFINKKYVTCPYNSQLSVKDSEHNITCPENEHICEIHRYKETYYYQQLNEGVAMWVQVKSPTPFDVSAVNGSEEALKSIAAAELNKQASVPMSWINRTILVSREQYVLGIFLVPPRDISKEDVDAIYHKIHELNDNGGLDFVYVVADSTTIKRRRETPWPFQHLRGVYLLLLMLGVVFVVVIVAAFGATVIQIAVGRPMVTRSRNRQVI